MGKYVEGADSGDPCSCYPAPSLLSGVANPDVEAAVVRSNDFNSAGDSESLWTDDEARQPTQNTKLGNRGNIAILGG